MCAITLNGEKLVTKDKTIKFSFKNKKKQLIMEITLLLEQFLNSNFGKKKEILYNLYGVKILSLKTVLIRIIK